MSIFSLSCWTCLLTSHYRHQLHRGCALNGLIRLNEDVADYRPSASTGESMLMAMKDVALSSGSACTSASLEPSYVLRALGAEDDMAHSSIRFGIGRFTTDGEIDFVIEKIVAIVERTSPPAFLAPLRTRSLLDRVAQV